jgi:hypothetical protein
MMKPKLTTDKTAKQVGEENLSTSRHDQVRRVRWMLALVFLVGWYCSFAQSKTDILPPSLNTEVAFSYKIFAAVNNTWGYDIFSSNKLTIHQPTIPGKPGNEGFKTKVAAQKVAELVVEKMKRGEMPPTITEEELKELNAI